MALTATLWVSRDHAMRQLAASSEATNVALTRSFANSLWPRFSGHLQNAVTMDPAALRRHPDTARLDAEVRLLARGLGVLKVKILTLSGRMIFNTDNADIGNDYPDSPGLRFAAQGQTVSQESRRREFSGIDGPVFDVDVISSYVPVQRADGRIEAVVEIYADITQALAAINRQTFVLGLRLFTVFALLYAVLFLIVGRGDGLLRRQYRELAETGQRMRAKTDALEAEIARRREVESEVLALREVQVADRAKNAMLANMSHELRTPLNAIIGFAQMIEGRQLGPDAMDRYAGYAGDIHRAGQHLLDIISNLLDLAKAEAGEIALAEAVVDLRATAAECTRLVEQRALAGGVALHCELGPEVPSLIADQRLIRQILINLLGNAVKFTRPGGHVQLEATRLDDGSLRIAVADTGIGIAARDIPRVMSPFGQVDDGLSRRYEGTGLGLPIVKTLVGLHGGTFRLESALGVGTVAICIFAANRVLSGPASPVAARPPAEPALSATSAAA